MTYFWTILSFLLFISLLIIVSYLKKKIWQKPSGIYIFFYFVVVVFATLYHFYTPKEFKINLYELDFISSDEFVRTIGRYLKMLNLILFGMLISWVFLRDKKILISTDKVKEILNFIEPQLILAVTASLLFFSVLLFYIDYGNMVFEREEYLPKTNTIVKTLYKNLLILVSFAAGIVYANNKGASISMIIIAVLCGLALGSRAASLYLLAYFIPILLESKKFWRFLFFLVPFMIIFLGFNISLRSESSGHGLIPYSKAIVEKPEIILKYTFENIYYTIIFGVYATAETIKHYNDPKLSYLLTYINPLPGSMTNWYNIYEKLRIGKNFPYTMLGEITKYPVFFIFYYFFLGVYFQILDYYFTVLIGQKKLLAPLMISAFVALFTIFSFEYGFRASHRYLLYCAIFISITWFFSKIKPIKWNP